MSTPAKKNRTKPITAPDTSPLLTVDQLAAILQLDRRTIERWTSAGKIPGLVKLSGRAIRFRRADVEKWIAAGCPTNP
jgi:excisionase family DNA binding protein